MLGLPREPKWSHLKYLHKAIKLAEAALVATDPAVTSLGNSQEVGQSLPMKMTPVNTTLSWQSYIEETASSTDDNTFTLDGLYEQINVTRDDTDYLWYMTDITIGPNEEFLKNGSYPLLTIDSAGHALHVFVNGQLSGTVYAGLAFPKLRFSDNVKLQAGINKLVLLSIAVGLPSFPFLFPLEIIEPDLELLACICEKIGMKGEALSLHTVKGSSSVEWVEGSLLAQKQPLTWYKVSNFIVST
ncbi:hypothetical protein M0R45_003545 [Rubus argutus]|uniref:Beta-galactosidase galactose-binding domain-containing protein n=1 Tax=Rubus argutus TaxID=59490 RepID=A0AAW1YH75_RUBAR